MFFLLACESGPDLDPYDPSPSDDTGDADTDSDTDSDTDTDLDLPVTVSFGGAVLTVSGTPLGIKMIGGAEVYGTFTYVPGTTDALPDDTLRGHYDHSGASGFELWVEGVILGGSGWARVEVEDLDPDTLRFLDGANVDQTMVVDGVADPTLSVSFAITDANGTALTTDALPRPFPFTAALPHSFVIENDGGRASVQLDTLE